MRRRALLLRVLTAVRSAVNTSSDLPCSTKTSNLGVSPTNRVTRVIFLMKPMTAVKPPQECKTLQKSDTSRLLRLNHTQAQMVVSLFGFVGRKVVVWLLFVAIMQVAPRRSLQTSHVLSDSPSPFKSIHCNTQRCTPGTPIRIAHCNIQYWVITLYSHHTRDPNEHGNEK
jgi:hypothetical protein